MRLIFVFRLSPEVEQDRHGRKKPRVTKLQPSKKEDSSSVKASSDELSREDSQSDDHSKTKAKLERKLNEILEKKDSLHLD